MGKDYYTYKEILLALREEYIKNQILLDKLNSYIRINGNGYKVGDVNLETNLLTANEWYTLPRIRLIISKKQNILQKILAELELCFLCKKDYSEFKGKAYFQIEKNGKDKYRFSFEKLGYLPFKEDFIPFVSITDQIDFDNTVNEILNSRFMSLTDAYIKINDLQTLVIEANKMFFNTSMNRICMPDFGSYSLKVLYNPKNDTLRFNLCNETAVATLYNLFSTEVPSYKIPVEYQKLIDDSKSADKLLRIQESDFLLGGTIEFSFEETKSKVILRRKK